MSDYQPQPGTIPHRAIAWLRSMQAVRPGYEPTTAEFCEGLGIDVYGFTASMRLVRERGLVHTRRVATCGKLFTLAWRLAGGRPDPGLDVRPTPDPELMPLQIRRSAPMAEWRAPEFRAVETPAGWVMTGVQIVNGAAVLTREQFAALREGA